MIDRNAENLDKVEIEPIPDQKPKKPLGVRNRGLRFRPAPMREVDMGGIHGTGYNGVCRGLGTDSPGDTGTPNSYFGSAHFPIRSAFDSGLDKVDEYVLFEIIDAVSNWLTQKEEWIKNITFKDICNFYKSEKESYYRGQSVEETNWEFESDDSIAEWFDRTLTSMGQPELVVLLKIPPANKHVSYRQISQFYKGASDDQRKELEAYLEEGDYIAIQSLLQGSIKKEIVSPIERVVNPKRQMKSKPPMERPIGRAEPDPQDEPEVNKVRFDEFNQMQAR